MKTICSNTNLVDFFVGDNTLIDGKIEKIEVFEEKSTVSININIHMRSSATHNKVKFKFSKCKQYSFSYSEEYYFYNIETIKLFKTGDSLFYISFDPYDENDNISPKDQDYILCKDIDAYNY
ncbi:hypothetical protein BTJ40_14470 [Microbulbifer sp. A4B17]|uniref:hypothetical protein n=1 Tax=Microbulbifer sp. A4B17 TaxID=359370 RepID=UPI000D52D692|nr:hypothetical protein [Microbulbifer sp. A4B17]AWF81933.1 hypothetical protein BTJ40_14470 [Microbulbifer sp. A4B17]